MSKRVRPTGGYGGSNKRPTKMQRVTGPTSSRGTYKRRPYVNRTPGGQVTADSQYFDAQNAVASLSISTSAVGWAGSRVEIYDNTPTTPVAIGSLFVPIEGNDISNRYGRKAFLKYIRIDGVLRMVKQVAQTTADNGCRVRVLVVQDNQCNGAVATGDLIIKSGWTDAVLNDAPNYMFQNTANFGRFKVLKDQKFCFGNAAMTNETGAAGGVIQSGQETTFTWKIKVNETVNFNAGNTGTIADIIDKAFEVYAHADNPDYVPTIVFKSRCVFKA